jgi:hypothetical protein
MTLSSRVIQPIQTMSGALAPNASVAINVAIPANSVNRLTADVLLVGYSNGSVDKCSALIAEGTFKNTGTTVTFITAQSGSTNPQNSNSTNLAMSRAVGNELVAGATVSTATWSASGSNAVLTITNASTTESCQYDAVIWATHHIAYQLTPADLPTVAWYRSDQGLLFDGTGLAYIYQWNSLVGSDPNLSLKQLTVSQQPSINPIDASYNRHPTLSFTATAHTSLVSGTWASAQAQPFTVCWVGNYDGSATGQTFVCSTSSIVELDANNPGTNACMYAGAFVDSAITNTTIPQVVIGVYDGVTSTIYVSAKTAKASGNAGGNGFTDLTLGYWSSGGTGLSGKIAEVAVIGAALTSNEVANLLTYFGNRYAIPIGP